MSKDVKVCVCVAEVFPILLCLCPELFAEP